MARLFEMAHAGNKAGAAILNAARDAEAEEIRREREAAAKAYLAKVEARARRIARENRDYAIAQLLNLTTTQTRKGRRVMVAKPGCSVLAHSLQHSAKHYAKLARPANGYPRNPEVIRPLYPAGALNRPVGKAGQFEALTGERARLTEFVDKARKYAAPTILRRLEDQLMRVSNRLARMYAEQAIVRTSGHAYEKQSFATQPENWA